MFIVFEGPDGCGKDTQLDLIEETLSLEEIKHFRLRDPGTTPIAEKIRYVLLNSEDRSQATEFMLFMAARTDLYDRHVKEQDGLILSGRWSLSTFVYQCLLGGISWNLFRAISEELHPRVPDILFYFDLDVDTAWERISKRPDQFTYFEKKGKDYIEQLINGYRKAISVSNVPEDLNKKEEAGCGIAPKPVKFAKTIIQLDAKKTIEELNKEILEILRKSILQ